MEHNLQCVRIY